MDAVQKKITTALLISTFLAAIEVTIISTAMPQITGSLGGLELMSWVFAIYLLTTSVTTPIWGKLADLVGRKPVYMIGVVIFLAGSLLCGLSQTMSMLIVFRALQGIGAGAINPVTFTMIADVFNFEQRAKVQGLVSSMWGIAGILGPLIGGFLVDFVSWHWVFFINIPFGIVSMWMIGRHYKETIEKRKRKIDYGGALTFTIGMTALLFALLSVGGETGGEALDTPWIYALYGVAVVFLVIFFGIQLKHEEPMMPMRLFKQRDVAVSNGIGFLTSVILIGLTAYLPLWIQGVLEMGATASGFALMPLSIGWPLAAMLTSKLLRRINLKGITVLGGALIAAGSLSFIGITSSMPIWVLVLIMFVIGLGFGFATTTTTIVIQSSVAASMRGAAGSLNMLLRTLGQTVGIAVLGSILNMNISGSMEAGLHAVFLVSAVIGVASWLVTMLIPKRTREQYERQAAQ